jgi:hypothetical protein
MQQAQRTAAIIFMVLLGGADLAGAIVALQSCAPMRSLSQAQHYACRASNWLLPAHTALMDDAMLLDLNPFFAHPVSSQAVVVTLHCALVLVNSFVNVTSSSSYPSHRC